MLSDIPRRLVDENVLNEVFTDVSDAAEPLVQDGVPGHGPDVSGERMSSSDDENNSLSDHAHAETELESSVLASASISLTDFFQDAWRKYESDLRYAFRTWRLKNLQVIQIRFVPQAR